MAFENVGAYINGSRPRTKKALKEALKERPTEVSFDATSMFAQVGSYQLDDLPGSGIKLSVTGPDPYTARNWYATVEVKADGTVKVS